MFVLRPKLSYFNMIGRYTMCGGTELMVNVTVMVCGLPLTPGAETVTCP